MKGRSVVYRKKKPFFHFAGGLGINLHIPSRWHIFLIPELPPQSLCFTIFIMIIITFATSAITCNDKHIFGFGLNDDAF